MVLSWDVPAEDAESVTGYEVLRAQGEAELATLVEDTGSTSTAYTDATATEPGVRYAYRVKALRSGEKSQQSDRAEVELPPDPRLLAPSNLTAEIVDDGVALSWEAPAEDAESVTAYEVLRAQGEAELATLVADTQSIATSYTDATATGTGVRYTYRVIALRSEAKSQASDQVEVQMPEPKSTPTATPAPEPIADLEAPIIHTAEALRHRVVQLDWDDVVGADRYEVQFYNHVVRELVDLPTSEVTVEFRGSGAVVSNLPEGVFWWLRVRAVNSIDASEWSEVVQILPTRRSDWERDDPTLSGLSLSGIDLGEFNPKVRDYAPEIGLVQELNNFTSTVTAVPAADGATVEITPDDADSDADGHQVVVDRDLEAIEVEVTAPNGVTRGRYTVSFTRPYAHCELKDFGPSMRGVWEDDSFGATTIGFSSLAEACLSAHWPEIYPQSAPEFPSHRYARYYCFVMEHRAYVRILLDASTGSRVALRWWDSKEGGSSTEYGVGEVMAQVETQGWGATSALARTLDPGVYVIEATSYQPQATGTFRLGVVGPGVVPFADHWLSSLGLSHVSMSGFKPEVTGYERYVAADVSTVTISAIAAQASGGATVAISPKDADSGAGDHQVDVEDDGMTEITITVTAPNGVVTRVYTVTLIRLDGTTHPLSSDSTLSELSLGGIGIGDFTKYTTRYSYKLDLYEILDGVPTTVTATPTHSGATVEITPPDADPNAPGHQIARVADQTVRIEVTPQDGTSGKRTYSVTHQSFTRNPSRDLAANADDNGRDPIGIWSDGNRMWVTDQWTSKVSVYDLASNEHYMSYNLGPQIETPGGLWSDGKTVWVRDYAAWNNKVYAYDLETWWRRPDRDITTYKIGGYAAGSDGQTIWVADNSGIDSCVHGYGLESRNLVSTWCDGGKIAGGMWSDGSTTWISYAGGNRVLARDLNAKTRQPGLHFTAPGGIQWRLSDNKGIWADGRTMWVVDKDSSNIYAYTMPVSARLRKLELSGIDFGLFLTGKFDYEATVANDVAVTTLTAAPAFPEGSSAVAVEVADGDLNTADADADEGIEGYQVNLATGANVFTITVTAPNGMNTETYTVTVNREAP